MRRSVEKKGETRDGRGTNSEDQEWQQRINVWSILLRPFGGSYCFLVTIVMTVPISIMIPVPVVISVPPWDSVLVEQV